MKEKLSQIPAPLRKQILLRCAGAGLGAAMLLIVLLYSGDWRFLIPCAAAAILCLASALLLYDRSTKGRYVLITGVCTVIERTGIRRRIKAIYLQTEEHRVRLVGVRPIRNLSIGDDLELYVADNTAVYAVDGSNVICSYIALAKVVPGLDSEKKEIPSK